MALSYAFNANAGETPQTLAQRRQLADTIAARIFGNAPKNLGEGLNAIGQALIARSMRDETDAAQKAGMETIPAWLGGTGASAPVSATPPALAAAPMGNLPTPQPTNTATKIYSNDEPSPLDPPSGADRQALIATILGEAGNQGPAGMNAVASVVRNRAVNGGYGGDTASQVVTAKNQFEPWNTPQGRANMTAAMQNPQQVVAANAAIDSAYAGNDPTNGATMFYSPTAQAALGRSAPSWAAGPGQDIGDHRFFGGAPQPGTQVAQATPTTQDDSGGPALAFAGQPTQSASPAPQPAQTPAQPAQVPAQPKSYGGPFPNVTTEDLTKQAFNPWLPASTKQILSAEITRRATADQQANDPLRKLQIQKAQRDIDQGNNPESVREFEYAQKNGYQGSFQDWIASKRAGAGEYGLQGIWGTGPDGKPAIIQLGKSGKPILTPLPDGFQPNKDAQKIDLGTHWGILDPTTRQLVTTIPKDLRGAEREKAIGTSQGGAVAAAPGDIQSGQNALDILQKIRDNPYIDRGTGITSLGNKIPGTGGYDFANLVEQAKSGAFLQAIQQMRGLGSLSNAEGGAATAAVTRMNTATSKEAFLDALTDYEKLVKQGMARAQSRLANPAATNPIAAPQGQTSAGVSWSVE